MANLVQTQSSVTVVLLDADGVTQTTPPSFIEGVRALCPNDTQADDFIRDLFAAEKPCLAGQGDFLEVMASIFAAYDVSVPVNQALTLWQQIDPVHEVLALAQALKSSGYKVGLATNQQAQRAWIMLEHLPYCGLFDHLFFSFELGVAKPEAAYFEKILQRLAVAPAQALFIDDHQRNVDSAAAVGLQAEQYHVHDGIERLANLLRDRGVRF